MTAEAYPWIGFVAMFFATIVASVAWGNANAREDRLKRQLASTERELLNLKMQQLTYDQGKVIAGLMDNELRKGAATPGDLATLDELKKYRELKKLRDRFQPPRVI